MPIMPMFARWEKSRAALRGILSRWFLGVETPTDHRAPASQRRTLVAYAAASMTYRVVVVALILWFVHRFLMLHRLEIVGQLLIGIVIAGTIAVPVKNGVHFFRCFDEVESGISVGPGSMLCWSLIYFLVSFCNTPRQAMFAKAIGRLLFFWLKYFDYMLNNRKGAMDSAGGFYFVGRNQKTVCYTLNDLVSDYRGCIR